jgi:oligopeptide transport system substrate-binding protein
LQFFRGSYNADYASYDNYLAPLFTTQGGQNAFHYSNAKVDQLVEQAEGTPSQDDSDSKFREAERQMLADQVVVPLDWVTASLVKSGDVQRLEVMPNGYIAYEQAWLRS